MNLKCLFGIHDWGAVTKCKCNACGKLRAKFHNWAFDCESCHLCGEKRANAHNWNGCKCSKCGRTRDEGHLWDGCKCTQCSSTRHQLVGCQCKICQAEVHDLRRCTCLRCGKSFHAWTGEECRLCGLSGSERNKTTKCSKCGEEASLFLSSSGETIYRLSEREARQRAFWCEQCRAIFCASCVGFPSAGTGPGISMFRSKCPACGGAPLQAKEECIAKR